MLDSCKLAAALLLAGASVHAAQGPSSSADAYLLPTAPGVAFTALLTTGDNIGGYAMAGVPDGLGAFDNGDGSFTLLMNHEFTASQGAVHAHGVTGSFVSRWVIDKVTLQVLAGSDLIRSTYDWNSATQAPNAAASSLTFYSLCSADLAPVSAYAYGNLGTTARLYLNGEEGGNTGWAMAHVVTGANAGSSYVLGKFNTSTNGSGGSDVGAWENLLANPYAQAKTVVIGNNDGGSGVMFRSLAVYVGDKTASGSEIERAGLTNGLTRFVNVAGVSNEIADATTRATGIVNGARFTLSGTASTTFSRPEDGAWNLANPREYYFVTTDRNDQTGLAGGTQRGGTRLWRLSFDDITNPLAGGIIEALIDTSTDPGGLGVNKPNMFDNISVNADGTITLLEDPGNDPHNAKVWNYNPITHVLRMVGKVSPALFGDVSATGVFTPGSHTMNEETSGVIDITALLGRNDGLQYSLLVVQDHASAASLGLPATLAEGGQLLLMAQAVPEPHAWVLMLGGLGVIGWRARTHARTNG